MEHIASYHNDLVDAVVYRGDITTGDFGLRIGEKVEDSIISQERCCQLEYSNDLYLFRLEQAEAHEEGLKKETRELKETLEETQKKRNIIISG